MITFIGDLFFGEFDKVGPIVKTIPAGNLGLPKDAPKLPITGLSPGGGLPLNRY